MIAIKAHYGGSVIIPDAKFRHSHDHGYFVGVDERLGGLPNTANYARRIPAMDRRIEVVPFAT